MVPIRLNRNQETREPREPKPKRSPDRPPGRDQTRPETNQEINNNNLLNLTNDTRRKEKNPWKIYNIAAMDKKR